jgi:excinuclease UvrABC ATPase subunit
MAELFESNWSATKDALLEGLNGSRKSSLDVVLENTKRYLQESASSGATQAGNVATLNKVMLPLIRRVMPSVIANELVTTNEWSCWTNPYFKNKVCGKCHWS